MGFFSALCILVFVARTLTQELGNAQDIVKKLHTCYNNSPNDVSKFNTCLKDFLTEIRPNLAVGVKELDIPSVEPLYIDRADFPENSALIQGIAYFYNLTIHGVGNYSVSDVDVDIPKQTINARLTIPNTVVDGDYNIDGNLLLLPIKGQGKVSIQLTNGDVALVIFVERVGTELKVVKTELDFTVEDIKFRLENLLGGKEVGDAINNLMNDNTKEVLRELKPLLAVKLAEAISKALVNVVKQVPSEAFVAQ